MTDMPATATGLFCCLLYMRMQTRQRERAIMRWQVCWWAWRRLCATKVSRCCSLFVVIAWQTREKGSGARGEQLDASLDKPVERTWRCFARPVVCVTCATALYNAHTFGSWRRSGYHYWTAVPYDFPTLVWSPRYISNNLFVLAAKQSVLIMLLGLAGFLLLRRRQNPALRSALRLSGMGLHPLRNRASLLLLLRRSLLSAGADPLGERLAARDWQHCCR